MAQRVGKPPPQRSLAFDDAPHGGCKFPASRKLLYLKDGAWNPVELDGSQAPGDGHEYETRKEQYNTVRFKPDLAEGVRI